MKGILSGWNFVRSFRLVLGTAMLVQGIVAKDTLPILLGVLFGGMAVANIGCCGTSACAINTGSDKRKEEDKL